MKSLKLKLTHSLAWGILSSFVVFQAHSFEVPKLTGPVLDEVGLLDRQDRRDLESLLYEINAKGLAQVQVAILKNLQGEPIESASIKLTDAWKLGDAKKDNGILFLISVDDKKMRIEVGQGLEGTIPDVIAKRILADQVRPLFRAKQYSAGVIVGVHEILRYVDAEYAQKIEQQPEIETKSHGSIWLFGLYVFIFILISLSRLRRRGFYSGSPYIGGWGGGGWGGGSGGGGSWSGGGGGFSGGGASSDW